MRRRYLKSTYRAPLLNSDTSSQAQTNDTVNEKENDQSAKVTVKSPEPVLIRKRPRATFNPPGVVQNLKKGQPTAAGPPSKTVVASKLPRVDDGCDVQFFTALYTKRAPNKARMFDFQWSQCRRVEEWKNQTVIAWLQKRKNKRYEDGVLEVNQRNSCTLYSQDGKLVGKAKLKDVWNMPPGAELTLGNWELEVDERLEPEKFRSGECFLPSTISASTTPVQHKSFVGVMKGLTRKTKPNPEKALPAAPPPPDALILNRDQWKEGIGKLNTGNLVHPVVVDAFLCRTLRPHQEEGVRFLYECAMGLREAGRFGAILADDMGLGKTLQVLVLIWTLLKQGPEGRPVAKKVVVVAPSTLVGNWANETKKWLGDARLKALPLQSCPEAAEKIRDFRFGVVHQVLVVSYELIRKFTKELAGCCDVLICDEGHRLKSAQGNKTINSLLELQCSKRILLTGTPIQNKLDEFYAMMSFVNPDLLGSLATFKRLFADPISKSRDRNASQEEKELGEERSRALNDRIARFVLRRTSELNAKHLPSLSVFIAFCKPSDLQVDLYNAVLRSGSITSLLSGTSCFGDRALSAIMLLRKLCNHPELLRRPDLENARNTSSECGDVTADLQSLFPKDFTAADPVHSGKLRCLSIILKEMVATSNDRIVVVSNSTANLDIIQTLCQQSSFPTVRIDGSTAVASRQDIVDNFNSVPTSKVFLLSTRAGGAGLNLIGANRLVLFDSDWNPAVDQQAMARIWRDGQQKACVVYRLLTTGTIDEKMYQRQLMKNEIADMVADRKEAARGFTKEELKELFTLNLDTDCNTRDILKKEGSDEWQNCGMDCSDEALRTAFACEVVSFVQEQRRVEKGENKQQSDTATPHCEPAKLPEHSKEEEVSKKPKYESDDIDILMIDD